MASSAILAIRIISDATKAAKGFKQTETAASKMERRLGTASKVATVVTASLLAMGVAGLKQASDLQQSSGAIQATFGQQSAAVASLAKQAAESAGLSRSSYQQLASTFGAQLKNMGVAANQLVPKTDKLIKLGADLAATYGGTTSEAVEAISSLLRGERDPIEKYGVGIKQADINARLAAQGQDKLTGAAKRQAETQATLALLTKQTASAHGQFARESNTAEGSTQRMQAKLDNAAASMSTVLLPAVSLLTTGIASLATFTENHTTAAQASIGVIGGLAVAVIAVNGAYKGYKAAAAAAAVAQKVFNLAMRANPIGLVVTAIALLVAGLVLAYKKSDTFRAIVNKVRDVGVAAFKQIWEWIKKGIDLVKDLIGWVKKLKFPSPPKSLSKLFGGGGGEGGPPRRGGGGGGGFAYSSLPGRGGPGGGGFLLPVGGGFGETVIFNITINDAFDPDEVARKLDKIITGRRRRLGKL